VGRAFRGTPRSLAANPAGRILEADVPAPELDRDIAARNRERGLVIDSTTALPQWGGERLDLGWAVTSLWYANHPEGLRGPIAA
jgi:hypothetical protein